MASKLNFISIFTCQLDMNHAWKKCGVVCYVSQANTTKSSDRMILGNKVHQNLEISEKGLRSSISNWTRTESRRRWMETGQSKKEGASSKHLKSRSSISPKRSFLMGIKEMAIDYHSYQTVKG